MNEWQIRSEQPADEAAIRQVNDAAFGGPAEGGLVDVLRVRGRVLLSLVAVANDEILGPILGHVLFSTVTIDDVPSGRRWDAVTLAPLAVRPGYQRRGIGSALTRAGLTRLAAAGHGIVIVLGHPEYYPRFGFRPASTFGIRAPWDVPDAAFMALELRSGALDGVSGVVIFGPEFDGV